MKTCLRCGAEVHVSRVPDLKQRNGGSAGDFVMCPDCKTCVWAWGNGRMSYSIKRPGQKTEETVVPEGCLLVLDERSEP